MLTKVKISIKIPLLQQEGLPYAKFSNLCKSKIMHIIFNLMSID